MLNTKMLKESNKLLREACKDKDGLIGKIGALSGLSIKTNGEEFVKEKDPISEALWTAAVDELESNDLIEDKEGNGAYFVTHTGRSVNARLEELGW